MSWHAKPSGGYPVGSTEWEDNIQMIYSMLSDTWTLQAISGMCGNLQAESGLNPWRWQSDSVSLTDKYKGYGLPQFTPAYGYIDNYGQGVSGYAPNLSVSTITQGASPTDGQAQIIVIDTDKAGKYLNRSSYCSFADIRGLYPFSNFKVCTDAWLCTVAWLYDYEFPASQYRTEAQAKARYNNTIAVYQYLVGSAPPDPPDPPYPPEPPEKHTKNKTPIYMYRRCKKWLY